MQNLRTICEEKLAGTYIPTLDVTSYYHMNDTIFAFKYDIKFD